MAISFDKALGIFPRAMELGVQRSEVLANNIANADTPGFKARDFDFKAALNQAQQASADDQVHLAQTERGHMGINGNQGQNISTMPQLLYRNPSQPSLDGNTVDEQAQMADYSRNAMQFRASFRFLNDRFKGLKSAITGR